jgi:hypothetical protein
MQFADKIKGAGHSPRWVAVHRNEAEELADHADLAAVSEGASATDAIDAAWSSSLCCRSWSSGAP